MNKRKANREIKGCNFYFYKKDFINFYLINSFLKDIWEMNKFFESNEFGRITEVLPTIHNCIKILNDSISEFYENGRDVDEIQMNQSAISETLWEESIHSQFIRNSNYEFLFTNITNYDDIKKYIHENLNYHSTNKNNRFPLNNDMITAIELFCKDLKLRTKHLFSNNYLMISTVLNPKYKYLKLFSEQYRNEIYSLLKSWFNEYLENNQNNFDPCSLHFNSSRFLVQSNQFQNSYDFNNIELNNYFSIEGGCNDIMWWWNRNKNYFPNLYEFAKRFFSIHPSAAPIERCWSLASYTITNHRQQMNNETFQNLLFYKYNNHLRESL